MATFTSKATGRWDEDGSTTWNEANYPTSGDTVTIQTGHVVSIEGERYCGNITIDSGGTLRFDGDTDSTPAILTLDNGATLANSGTIDQTGTGSTGYASLVGTSLEQLTGTNMGTGTGYWHIAQLELVPATSTGGGGCTIIIDDDVKFTGGLTLTAGDTMSCTVQDTNIDNGDHWFAIYGTLTLTGTSGHPITVTKDSGSWEVFNCVGAIYLQYVTITDYCLMIGGGTTIPNHTLDNVSVSAGNDYGIYVYGTSQTVIATNCAFSGGDDADWNSTDVSVKTGGSLVLVDCTYTTLGINATGATWVIDKTGSDFTIYGNITDSESVPTNYRAADITGNLTLSLADKYGTPFDTSYTLGANCPNVDNLVINASCILTDATNNVGLTVSGLTSITGTLTCGTAAMSFGSGVTNNFALTVIGTFNGGSGTHTMGSFFLDNGTATFTSGVTTLDSRQLSSVTFGTENGTFNHGSGTITFTMANYQLIYDLTNTARTFYNLIINKASNLVQFSNSSGYTLTIANDFTITSGEFDTSERTGGASRNLIITGNLSNADTFTCNSGLVTLNGTTQTITGSWTFWSFTKSVGAADTLTFDNTGTYTFGGNVTLNGASGELLSILSDSAGNAFDFVMSSGAVKTDLSYLSVKDSDASGSDATQKPIAPTNSTFVSGNTDWESSGSVTIKNNQTIFNKYYY